MIDLRLNVYTQILYIQGFRISRPELCSDSVGRAMKQHLDHYEREEHCKGLFGEWSNISEINEKLHDLVK